MTTGGTGVVELKRMSSSSCSVQVVLQMVIPLLTGTEACANLSLLRVHIHVWAVWEGLNP